MKPRLRMPVFVGIAWAATLIGGAYCLSVSAPDRRDYPVHAVAIFGVLFVIAVLLTIGNAMQLGHALYRFFRGKN